MAVSRRSGFRLRAGISGSENSCSSTALRISEWYLTSIAPMWSSARRSKMTSNAGRLGIARIVATSYLGSSLPGRRLWPGGGRDGDAGDAALGDALGHQARGLRLLDEGVQVLGRRGAGLRGADRLLDAGELAVEQAGARELGDVDQQARPQAGERFELVVDERLDGFLVGLGQHQAGMLDVALQVETVRGLLGD